MLVEDPLFFGGAEIHAYEIAKNLVKQGHKVDFIQLYGFPRKREFQQNTLLLYPSRWISAPVSRLASCFYFRILWLYSFFVIPLICGDLIKGKYDILHVHGFGYSSLLVSAVLVKKLVPCKIVCTLHNDLPRHIDRKLIKLLTPYVDEFVAVSRSIQKRWQALYGSKPLFIPNGVDVTRFNPRVDGSSIRKELGIESKFIVLSIGRLSSQKGLEYLIRAAAYLRKEGLDFVVLICGRGEQETWLKHLAENLRLKEIVRFQGFIPANLVPMYYAACDVFVLSSVYETFALTLLEALSTGKPVICTKVGGAQELASQFEPSLHARLVEPKNPKDLAKEISWYYNHPEFARQNTEAVYAMIKDRYSWENISIRIDALYQQLRR